jgi:thiamine pyrophosphate-dependent acetolactate synthase large subunit-like protein
MPSAKTIIVDESITSGATLRDFLVRTTADSFYGMRGGGLGWGLPATVGVKRPPDRPVLGIIGDGSTLPPTRRCGRGGALPDPSRMAHL